ncbi:MAG: Bug family tripartite tricarboxylate transporter substrate binding protein [Syntrophales bacterium]
MKRVMALAALLILVLVIAAPAPAQTYPEKPIRIIVAYTPGGGNDIAARLIAPKLSEALGQPVIVENRPGAGTNIGQELVARSAPDGYTLLLASPAVTINPSLYKNLPYNALRDMTGVSMFAQSANLLAVNPSLPAKNVKELIALAQSKPGRLTFSSSGVGSSQHLTGELFNLRANVKMLHIPYKGTAPSMTAVLSGEVDMTFTNIPAALPHIKSGRLRIIANTTGKRAELLPDVPTLKESGVDVTTIVWFAIMAPAATPRPVIDKLAGVLMKMPHAPEMKKRLADLGAEPVGSTPDEFSKFLRDETAQWAEVIKAAGVKTH